MRRSNRRSHRIGYRDQRCAILDMDTAAVGTNMKADVVNDCH